MLENLDKLRGATRERAKYEVIKEFLLEEFMKGSYEVGQALPSENTLANTVGVARSTVRQAISELEKDGLVQRIQGKGSYFTGNPRDKQTQKLEVFSLIVPDISRGLYPILVKGFDYQAGLNHQQVMVSNTDLDISKQGNLILQMIDKNVAGVVLVPAPSPPTPPFHIRQLQRNGIPVVVSHRAVEGSSAPLITWSAEEVAEIAGQAFVDHGHRRIAYFSRYRYLQTEGYENGLRQVLQKNGLDLPESHVWYGSSLTDTPDERKSKAQALKAMIKTAQPVTAIFCHDDDEAELINHLAMELGIKVPRDLSLIGFGDSHDRTGVFRSRLTSVTVNEFDIGTRAARVLQEIRSGQQVAESNEIILKPLKLVEGETLGAVPKVRA